MEYTDTKDTAITYRNFDNIRWQVEYNISHGKPARLMNLTTGDITVIPPLFDLNEGVRCYNTFWIKSKGRRFKYTSGNFYGEQIHEYLKTFGLETGRNKDSILRLSSKNYMKEVEFDRDVLQDMLQQFFGVLDAIDIEVILKKIYKYNKVYTWYTEDGMKIDPLPVINPELNASSFIEFGRHWYPLYDLTRPETDRDAQVVATMICYYLSQNIKPALTPRQLAYQHVKMEDHDMSDVELFKKCYGS